MRRSIMHRFSVCLPVAVVVAGLGAGLAPAGPAAAQALVSVGSPTDQHPQNAQNEPALAVDASRPDFLAAGANKLVDMQPCSPLAVRNSSTFRRTIKRGFQFVTPQSGAPPVHVLVQSEDRLPCCEGRELVDQRLQRPPLLHLWREYQCRTSAHPSTPRARLRTRARRRPVGRSNAQALPRVWPAAPPAGHRGRSAPPVPATRSPGGTRCW